MNQQKQQNEEPTMNRSQLNDQLKKEISDKDRDGNTDQDLAQRIVKIFFQGIKNALDDGDKVELRSFGSFHLKRYGGYLGRNPKTGQQVKVKPKRLPVFKIGKELKEKINQAAKKSGEAEL